MNLYYSLRISAPDEQYAAIDAILNVKSNFPISSGWGVGVTIGDDDPYISFINVFLDILEGKYDELNKIGVTRDHISIWKLYEYENQCNMEFMPKDMYRMGKEGIAFCVSCWEEESDI